MRVTSWRDPSPRHCACEPGNAAPLKEMLERWRAVGNVVSDFISRIFEPQIYRFGDKLVTVRLTGR